MRKIWITWENQRRNRSMAASVGASLYQLEHKGNALARYAKLSWQTIGIIRTQRPDVIFFQNPSLVLAALVATLKFLSVTRARIVGDFHNAGVYPPAASFLVPWIVRNSDLVLVSNKNLEAVIVGLRGRCISVPDPVPQISSNGNSTRANPQFEVMFICSWASDEPIANVLSAAQSLQSAHPDVKIVITGRPRLEKIGWTQPVPANVQLTGFLSEHDFEERLRNSAAALDLTTRSDCMVCGAYEALAVEVPMIVSDNEPTRLYFHKGALYTDNSAADIARRIVEMKARHAQLKREVGELKRELLESEKVVFQKLTDMIAAAAGREPAR